MGYEHLHEWLNANGIGKALLMDAGYSPTGAEALVLGKREKIQTSKALRIQEATGFDVPETFIWHPTGGSRWPKATRIRVKRSKAMKRAWKARKANGHAEPAPPPISGEFIILTKDCAFLVDPEAGTSRKVKVVRA